MQSHTGQLGIIIINARQTARGITEGGNHGNDSPVPVTLQRDVEWHSRERRVYDVAQVHLLLLVEVQLPASAAGEAERDELLRLETVERLRGGRPWGSAWAERESRDSAT